MDVPLSLIEKSLSRDSQIRDSACKMHEVQEETHFSLLGC